MLWLASATGISTDEIARMGNTELATLAEIAKKQIRRH